MLTSENSRDSSRNSTPHRVQSPIKGLKAYNTSGIKILLLENVDAAAVQLLEDEGYQVPKLPLGFRDQFGSQ